MPENDKKSEKKKGKSFMQVYREVNEKEQAEKLRQESELEAKRAERERRERENYAERLRQEKLELLKLKQGVISEEDIPKEERTEKHYTIAEKIGNFCYHNKMYIIFFALFGALAIFLIYDLISTVRPDVAVMIIAVDDEFQYITSDMEKVFERYCRDYNGDGKIYVRVSYLPANDGEVSYFQQANSTKLMAEFQAEDSIVVIADRETCEDMGITEGVLADLRDIYPGDESASELGYMLNGTSFAEDIGYDGLADDLFIAFRLPRSGFGASENSFQQNYDNAIELWSNYINGTEIDPLSDDAEQ